MATKQKNPRHALEKIPGDGTDGLIVGLGASAGGLEALQLFFSSIPVIDDLSFVVVQHLSPDYKSLLAEILSKYTFMKVMQAENEMEVKPNHVYLIPPKNNMVLRENKLYLTEYIHGEINHPIDLFFASLAEERKERSIAVVFSGTGSDGTKGIKSIKEHGGLVIVQQPESAKFDGMPRSAINTGLADFILTPQGIAEEILNFSTYPAVVQDNEIARSFSDEELLKRIFVLLKKACGIDFTHYKRTTVTRRIERRMVVTHKNLPADYVDFLDNNEEEARFLGKEILIGVTNFFRDGNYFDKLKTKAIYDILSRSAADDTIRVWVAGCSTGEEAYTIAILFCEVMEELKLRRDVKIFATDVDIKAIETAGKGIYTDSIINDISQERLAKFFTMKDDKYRVGKVIRKMIIFAPHNIFQDPPFGKLDLISCRNVLIYFQPVLQKNLFGIFHSALKDRGYLFLGKSETAGEFENVFKIVSPVEKIYVHTVTGKLPELTPITYSSPLPDYPQYEWTKKSREETSEKKREDAYAWFFGKFLPPAVIVDEKNTVVHFFGSYGEFFRIGPGKASFNIFDLIADDLSLAISTGLNKCRNEGTDVSYTDVSVRGMSGHHVVNLMIQAMDASSGVGTGMIAIILTEHSAVGLEGTVERYDIDKTAAQRIIDLERGLQRSQEDLKSTIGELETVNEELQAANEELLTANEELQSSNEELQSVNEELYTVNSEYQQKLDELTIMTNDMSNFLSSTMIGLLFVDSNLNIRKFTDYVAREFELMAQDIGRPMKIISHCFPDEDIVSDAAEVLKTLAPINKEVISSEGKHYTERIAPYRTADNSIKGLVFTIIDSLGMSSRRDTQ